MARSLVSIACCVALLLSAAEAEARYTGKDALSLIKLTFASCSKPPKAQRDAIDYELELNPHGLEARRRGKLLEVSIAALGNGVDGHHLLTTWLVDPKRCAGVGIQAGTRDGQLRWSLSFLRDRRRAPTKRERQRLLELAGYTLFRRGKPRFAAAALMASEHRCGALPKRKRAKKAKVAKVKVAKVKVAKVKVAKVKVANVKVAKANKTNEAVRPWAISRPLAPKQRWYRGKPKGSGLTAWLRGSKAQGVSFVRDPKALQRVGRFVLYSGTLGGRSRDQALAVYDARRKRHRWIVQTRACTSGALEWLGRRGALLLARAVPTHGTWRRRRGDSLLFVDLRRGRAHRLILGAVVELRSVVLGAKVLEVSFSDDGKTTAKVLVPWRAVKRRIAR